MLSALRYITSALRYHPRYQSRSSMYIHGLIPWHFAELEEAVPIDKTAQFNCGNNGFTTYFKRISTCITRLLVSFFLISVKHITKVLESTRKYYKISPAIYFYLRQENIQT